MESKQLPGIKRNVSLEEFTTFRIGGKAKYFFVAKNEKDLIEAVKFVKDNKLPFFIFGGGSNLLVSDGEFKGIVIKTQNRKLESRNSRIIAESGTLLGKIVQLSVKKGLTGLEWASGIPGTVGGAVYGNAGWPSNQKNIASAVEWVRVLEIKPKFKIKNYRTRDCKFGYRDSVFKHKSSLIILSVCLRLKKGDINEIKREISEILKKRREKTPAFFSAGSIFKNPKSFPAGYLIEKCGLKGKKVGQAKISEKHANFIINLGGAKAKDVKSLINLAKKEVKKKFKISLEEEIQFL
ncbi:MAG: UDP-N-acetylmuramate dehydrogenase [bacterium]|nr:UDP-N-acetylmuramate dehydrogenase [bacterium]